MAFCTDTDLLYWEPNLFKDAATAAQTLLSGVANVSGTGATFAGLSLADAGVKPLDVILFTGSGVAGAFPIVSVDSETSLTMSVLYDGLETAAAAHVGAGTSQAFSIRTFWPQRGVVTRMLLQAAGLDPAGAGAESRVVNVEVMRRPCVLGALQMIYSAMAASAVSPANFTARAELYERLYRRAMRSARVEIDADEDGRGGVVRELNLLQFVRG